MQELNKIGHSFWYMTPVSETDRPILGMVVGREMSLMIDVGNSEAHATLFLEKLAEQSITKPNIVVLTHWHWDHIFGMSKLKDSLSISSSETKIEMSKLTHYKWTDEALDERVKEGLEIEFCATCIKEEFGQDRNIHIVLPKVTFDRQLEIDLGGVTCVLKHVGGDHSHDSVVVYIKEEKILFLGDSIYPDIFSAKRNYTTKRTLKLIQDLETFDAETYILSHSGVIDKNEYLQETQMLKSIAHLTDQYKGDAEKIKTNYKHQLGRELNEEELETIEYFVNGTDALS
ncbi:glyoxylase-like metal-dependent hydrolase (beta-lactamase superfamily II) [Bacillus mesophilus]|uniref:MBL fold metallo-hydrolase n=1 Tax=Bacillus mesophilus TaxID=1808955 RepID=A0A6M0Q445_9BACI|nr:MBL fold metallo-hydrolase [Bacillus mesophilus]MBM7660258.1 glyoxylase-like metal-dependent hydrolase (beta-lactamase superfamily II) [Bacillus mesophilus]NEY70973.1 MBL fold metallo-hydrolase [Bacillus mesophilus]